VVVVAGPDGELEDCAGGKGGEGSLGCDRVVVEVGVAGGEDEV